MRPVLRPTAYLHVVGAPTAEESLVQTEQNRFNVPGRLQDATCNIIVILIYSCLAVVELPAMVFSLLQHNLNSSGNWLENRFASTRRRRLFFTQWLSAHCTVRPCVQWPIFKGDLTLAKKMRSGRLVLILDLWSL